MFSWATETIERLAWHIASVSRQRTMAAITYYRRKGEVDIVQRIEFARKLSKKYKVLLQAKEIEQEMREKENDREEIVIKEDSF